MKIEIKHAHTGDVLFTHTCDGNTVAITGATAVKSGADLRGADLLCDDLRGACVAEGGEDAQPD